MRIAALFAAAAGCGRPASPAVTVDLATHSAQAAPPDRVPVAVATAARQPSPPPAPVARCAPGAPVDPSKVYELVTGSFSGPGVDEMICEVDCDPETGPFGGDALVRRTNGAWTTVRVIPRQHPRVSLRECQRLRLATGRDVPICRQGSMSYGEVHDSVVALDYTKAEGEELVRLVAVADTTDTACTGQTDLLIGSIVSVVLVDLDQDGSLDVRVTVRAAKIHVPPQPPCRSMGFAGAGQPPPHLPTPAAQTIDFISRGESLSPTPGSARVLKTLAATMRQ